MQRKKESSEARGRYNRGCSWEERVSAPRDILSSPRIHLTSTSVLHPYSAIVEETDAENGCFGGSEVHGAGERYCSRYAHTLALLKARMIYIPLCDPFGMPSLRVFFFPPLSASTYRAVLSNAHISTSLVEIFSTLDFSRAFATVHFPP